MPEPARVSERVLIRHVHDGMVLAADDGRAGTLGLPPVGAFDVLPPLRAAAAAVDLHGLNEEGGARREQILAGAWVRPRIEPALGERNVVGRRDEAGELRVRHLVAIDPESGDADDMREAFFRLLAV